MLALYRTSQALAAIRGRSFAIPDDVKALAQFVLSHRLIAKSQSMVRGHTTKDIVSEVVDSGPVPVEEEAGVAGFSPG